MSTSERLPLPTEADVAAAKRLAGRDWYSLTAGEVSQAIVLERFHGLLGKHTHQAGKDGSYVVCQVGPYCGRGTEFH